jgi:hypothetical protein
MLPDHNDGPGEPYTYHSLAQKLLTAALAGISIRYYFSVFISTEIHQDMLQPLHSTNFLATISKSKPRQPSNFYGSRISRMWPNLACSASFAFASRTDMF